MKVLKTDIPVAAGWLDYEMGDIVHIGHQRYGFVTVWWLTTVGGYRQEVLPQRRLRVFATGQEIDQMDTKSDRFISSPVHLGTAVDLGTKTVWHLLEDRL